MFAVRGVEGDGDEDEMEGVVVEASTWFVFVLEI